jgi:hypothetical protein
VPGRARARRASDLCVRRASAAVGRIRTGERTHQPTIIRSLFVHNREQVFTEALRDLVVVSKARLPILSLRLTHELRLEEVKRRFVLLAPVVVCRVIAERGEGRLRPKLLRREALRQIGKRPPTGGVGGECRPVVGETGEDDGLVGEVGRGEVAAIEAGDGGDKGGGAKESARVEGGAESGLEEDVAMQERSRDRLKRERVDGGDGGRAEESGEVGSTPAARPCEETTLGFLRTSK